MVVCIHIPRFQLTVAAGGTEALAAGLLALAPMAGGKPCVGEVSGAAQAHGVSAGMALSEALARCPELVLVPANPLAVEQAWEGALVELEGIGAAIEPARAGLAYFEASGLRGLYGSERAAMLLARRALGRPARIGAGPTRFCALAAALEASPRKPRVIDPVHACAYIAAQPVGLLDYRADTRALVEPLTRLGVCTLGELVALGPDALADRFGRAGIAARCLALGQDRPPRARAVPERIEEFLDVGDASSAEMLRRVLGVLVDRLLARPERRGRTFRTLILSACLEGGGTWRERAVLRQPQSDAERIRLGLISRLSSLPAPAQTLGLSVECFGPAEGEQQTLHDGASAVRRERLGEAVNQVRAAAGPEAALRAVCVDPESRVPERRVVLTPMPG